MIQIKRACLDIDYCEIQWRCRLNAPIAPIRSSGVRSWRSGDCRNCICTFAFLARTIPNLEGVCRSGSSICRPSPSFPFPQSFSSVESCVGQRFLDLFDGRTKEAAVLFVWSTRIQQQRMSSSCSAGLDYIIPRVLPRLRQVGQGKRQ